MIFCKSHSKFHFVPLLHSIAMYDICMYTYINMRHICICIYTSIYVYIHTHTHIYIQRIYKYAYTYIVTYVVSIIFVASHLPTCYECFYEKSKKIFVFVQNLFSSGFLYGSGCLIHSTLIQLRFKTSQRRVVVFTLAAVKA